MITQTPFETYEKTGDGLAVKPRTNQLKTPVGELNRPAN